MLSAQARQLIHAQLGETLAITPLASGADHWTYAAGEEWIVRVPREPDVPPRLRVEAEVMPRIADRLPLAVPRSYLIGEAEDGDLLFLAHRRVEGLCGESHPPAHEHWQGIAQQLGEFFSVLHSIPPPAGVPHEPPGDPSEMLAEFHRVSHPLKAAGLPKTAREFAEDPPTMPPAPEPARTFCHGDTKGEHFLLSPGLDRAVGVIDWTDLCFSDPTWDFAGLVIWLGPAFAEQTLASYRGPDPGLLLQRALWIGRLESLRRLARYLNGEHVGPLKLLTNQVVAAFAG